MSDKCNAPVGVFDSGVGGLTVAREIMRNLPEENIVYFGDTARVPYGTKSKDTVLRYSRQIIRFLKTQDVKAIVIACNTASAYALEDVEKELDIPIIGVVKPGQKMSMRGNPQQKDRCHRHRSNNKFGNLFFLYHQTGPADPGDRQGMSAVCAARRRRMAERLGDI